MKVSAQLEAKILGLSDPQRVPLPAATDEKTFMSVVLGFARAHGWKCYHVLDSRGSEAGFPDIIACRRRVQLAIELKMPGKEPTAEQREWLDALALSGAIAGVWRPADWKVIQSILA